MKESIIIFIIGAIIVISLICAPGRQEIGHKTTIGGKVCIYTPRGQYEVVDKYNYERSIMIYEREKVLGKTMEELSDAQIKYFKVGR